MSNTDDSRGRPLFIVGMPRSGTKLLRAILNEHPMVAISDIETEFFPYWVANWPSYGSLSDLPSFTRFCADFQSYPFSIYLAERGTPLNSLEWFDTCDSFSPAGVFEALLKLTTNFMPGQHRIWGDKSPTYLLHLGLLRQHFPTARFIHIYRDVRDYCLSIHNAWGKNMLRAAQRWSDDISSARRVGLTFARDYMEIRYEDLLGDPAAESKILCEFLELPYYPDMVQLSVATENLGDARGQSKIVRSNSRKYESGLGYKQRRNIESVALPTLRELGYDVSGDVHQLRIGHLHMGLLRAIDGINLLRSTTKQRGLVSAISFIAGYNRITGNRQVPKK